MQASNAPGNPPDDSSPTAANSANSGSPLDEPCPTLEQLAALSRGTLAPIDEAALIAHLDRCPRCCGRLEAIDGPTPPPAALGRWSSIEMAPPALAALLSRWKRESPDTMDVDRRAAPPGATAAAKGASSAERSRMEADYVVHMLRSSGPPTDPKYLCRLGRYDVIEIVGQGGMAIVFKARDASLQRITAIKVLRPHLAADPLARKRFVREGQAVAAVRDPHVIGVYAVEEDVALPYLVMEFVAGTSLQERLDRHGPPTLAETLRIGRQIAAGLAAAHAQGLIHRDVKPANVLLENGGQRVKISDFGLARQTDATALTESGVVAGTPAYMSPEQVQGAALDPRSDLFSLGSVLYTMCTGRPPFNAATLLSTMRQVAEDAPPPIRNLNADSPPWLADVIRKLHEKSPG
ncbi:MAG TPA: protein kinase, partial [Pirellulales bacterium]